jgi:hypothetical protein
MCARCICAYEFFESNRLRRAPDRQDRYDHREAEVMQTRAGAMLLPHAERTTSSPRLTRVPRFEIFLFEK